MKEILYDKLVETIKGMRKQDKFNFYHYELIPTIVRGNEEIDEYEFGTSTKNSTYETLETSQDKHGNEKYLTKKFDINFKVFNQGAYAQYMHHVTHSWRFNVRIFYHRTSKASSLAVSLDSDRDGNTFVFPVEKYFNEGKSVNDILRKFEHEFMEVPPCIFQQEIIYINTEHVEFLKATGEQLETMYEAIQCIEEYYDDNFEKRKLLVHTFKDFPTELLRNFIFKVDEPSKDAIHHLHLHADEQI